MYQNTVTARQGEQVITVESSDYKVEADMFKSPMTQDFDTWDNGKAGFDARVFPTYDEALEHWKLYNLGK